jgi:hypothetical protein
MTQDLTWRTKFDAEIQRAEAARSAGNEGMARVCARRAAGLVAAEYLNSRGIHLKDSGAYAHITYLALQPEISSDLRDLIGHFTQRVTAEHELPVKADLISEACWLASQLLDA